MEFDPVSGALKCPYCGVTQQVSRAVNTEVREMAFDDYAGGVEPSRLAQLSEHALEVSCSGCGSVTEFEPGSFSGVCAFCAAKIVAQPKEADPLIAPNGVLPFSISRQQASSSIRQWLASRWFAPNGLKELARHDGIFGVYVPYWTFDAHADSEYRGYRGDYYYENQHVTRYVNGRQVTTVERVRKTRWTPAAGQVANSFDDVLVAATRSIPPKRLQDLDPWDLDTVQPYEPAYLSGFQAQRYQVQLPDGFEAAKSIMATGIRHTVAADIGGDEQRIDHIGTKYSGVMFKHLLLPVWIGAYRFRSEVFQVIVNARTGEVQGERPYSAVKIALAVLVAVVAVLIAAYFNR
jgi:hypothetical protein